MDIPSERARRKNRSSTNLNHLTLAPLTSRLPLDNTNDTQFVNPFPQPSQPSISYLQGKSAPTTPRLLSHSPVTPRSRSRHRRTPSAPGTQITKSKSSTQISHNHGKRSIPGTMTPGRRRDEATLGPDDRKDSDWLLRAAAMVATETRESKGQAWLVSRQSSTSLAGPRDAEEEAFEEELQRERDLASRRGSSAFAEEDFVTPNASRFQSRSHSRVGRRSRLITPLDRPDGMGPDSYFPDDADDMPGPDFVNLDERLEALDRDTTEDDEAAVRKLVRRGQNGTGSWLWSLFAVDENEQEGSEDEGASTTTNGDEATPQQERANWSDRRYGGGSVDLPEDQLPPPKADEGGWKDAAWLMSVATKVMF